MDANKYDKLRKASVMLRTPENQFEVEFRLSLFLKSSDVPEC